MNHSLQDAILQVCHVTAFQWADGRRISLSYWPVSRDGAVLALKAEAEAMVGLEIVGMVLSVAALARLAENSNDKANRMFSIYLQRNISSCNITTFFELLRVPLAATNSHSLFMITDMKSL